MARASICKKSLPALVGSALFGLIAAVWVLLAPALVGAQESPELYLLDFHSDGYLLAESVPVYGSGLPVLIDFAFFLDSV